MLTVQNAQPFIENQLKTDPTIESVWSAFKELSRQPVEGEEEVALLFQCGTYDFTGEKKFHFTFTRQFSIEEEDEPTQLHCEFLFEPLPIFKNHTIEEWYFEYEGELDDFFSSVENADAFQLARDAKPSEFSVYIEEI
ncbi:hypothetical protein [Priestia koreensis]|uniref:hypothetical protein n=1 Tax=Priestia koreensis TaxID=284581 RepID=UPI001F5ADD92|nr:hypothetical protein [Priestia koreensis]UNL83242.1 hypothetical protein IE339_13765 [Priestia koreensis]